MRSLLHIVIFIVITLNGIGILAQNPVDSLLLNFTDIVISGTSWSSGNPSSGFTDTNDYSFSFANCTWSGDTLVCSGRWGRTLKLTFDTLGNRVSFFEYNSSYNCGVLGTQFEFITLDTFDFQQSAQGIKSIYSGDFHQLIKKFLGGWNCKQGSGDQYSTGNWSFSNLLPTSQFSINLFGQRSGVSKQTVLLSYEVYPTVGDKIIFIRSKEIVPVENAVSIYDYLGRLIQRTIGHASEYSISVDVSSLAQGSYWLIFSRKPYNFIISR